MTFLLVLLALFLLFLCFFLYTRKYANPFKLIYIFGKKGAGKSTLMVKDMLKHQKRGWTIYTDMPDCLVPGARLIKTLDIATFIPPRRSCLFLEEVGISLDNRKFKDFPDGLRDFVKFMRKYGIKCYMNSQAYDVDKKVRDCVDGMILVTSVADCISISRPIYRTVTLTEPSADKESRIADKLTFGSFFSWSFTWMPRYHKYFDSFSAPHREPISFVEVTREFVELTKGEIPPALRRSFDRYEKRK